jgi:TIR domain-containing protein
MIFERGYFNSNKIEKGIINESLSETKTFSFRNKIQYKPTVFLCHKHSDLEDLQGVMGKLQEMGAKVYIDSMDNTMPDQTSGDTAQRIKEVIKYCKKFILLATEKAIESVWCNWELGIGDTYKYIDNIAILPMKEVGTLDRDYKGNEYLQIYPSINYTKGFRNIHGEFFEEGFYYEKPKDKNGKIYITKLSVWLNQ